MKSLKKYLDRAVYIQWNDSFSEHGWQMPSNGKFASIKSIGILIRYNQESVTITTSVTQDGHVIDQLTIPRSTIVSIKKLSAERIWGGKLEFK